MLRVKGNPQGQSVSKIRRIFGNTMWLISLGRNAIVVFFGIGLAYMLSVNGHTPFTLTGLIY